MFWGTVILAICGAGGYGWYLQSVYHAMVETGRAAEAGQVERFEQFVDLESLAESGAKLTINSLKDSAADEIGGLGGIIVGGLANVFGEPVAKASSKEIAKDIREEVEKGGGLKEFGAFTSEPGFFPFDVVDKGEKDGQDFVTTRHPGTCNTLETAIDIVWTRTDGEYPLLKSWRATRFTPASYKALLKTCERGKKLQGKKPARAAG